MRKINLIALTIVIVIIGYNVHRMQNKYGTYTLCPSRDSHNDYKINTILKFSIHNGMKLAATYILPHDIYSSFCVSREYIFASQKVSGTTIEKIKK